MATSVGEYEFVEEPSRDFFCPVTFELLIDPVQTNFCFGVIIFLAPSPSNFRPKENLALCARNRRSKRPTIGFSSAK